MKKNRAIQTWKIRHFSHANAKGPGQDDVPSLLRNVAQTIEQLGDIEVQDVTFGTEITEDGAWHSLTVYFHKVKQADDKGRSKI